VRGIRNNNPGNIRIKSALTWAGQGRAWYGFLYSSSSNLWPLVFGLCSLILLGKHKRGLDTIQELINVWAPPIENDTTAYINNVSARSGIPKNVVFSPTKANFLAIAKAMAISENGADALLIPDSDWNEGWRLATQRADIKSYVK
jgi:hypothetical protein